MNNRWRDPLRTNRVVCRWDSSRAGCHTESASLPDDTLVIPVELSGDCFYWYIPVVFTGTGYITHPSYGRVCGYAMKAADDMPQPVSAASWPVK